MNVDFRTKSGRVLPGPLAYMRAYVRGTSSVLRYLLTIGFGRYQLEFAESREFFWRPRSLRDRYKSTVKSERMAAVWDRTGHSIVVRMKNNDGTDQILSRSTWFGIKQRVDFQILDVLCGEGE